MGKLLIAAACLFLLKFFIRAEEPAADPIAAKLTTAKEAFYADRDKAEQALIALLEKKEAAAKQAGDIKTIEAVRVESEAFRKEGKLPKLVPLTAYDAAMKLARTKLENVFLAAIKTHTQADKLEEAKAIQKQLDEFRMSPKINNPPPPVDPLQPNSVWVATTGEEDDVLTIQQRKNDFIEARIVVKKLNREKIVTGTFKDGKFVALSKDAVFIKGKDFADLEATLEKDEKGYFLDMKWRSTKSNASGKFQLRLKE